MTNKELRRHIRKIRFGWILTGFLMLLSLLCIGGSIFLHEYCYSKWLNCEDPENQVSSVERAISLRPKEINGYYRLLDIYLQDGILDIEEAEAYRSLLNHHRNSLDQISADASALYRRLAFQYLSSFDAPAELRFQNAYAYFLLAQTPNTQDVEGAAIDTYLQIGAYYSEYVWITGSLRQPDRSEVEQLLKQLTAMMGAFPDKHSETALAYTCCLAALLDAHGQLWIEKGCAPAVMELAGMISQQTQYTAQTPAANRLLEELRVWENQSHPWKEIDRP